MEFVGSLSGTPWMYAIVATSVLLDVFLPLLPSGALVIMAATAAAGTTTAADAVRNGATLPAADHLAELLALLLCAATASVLGDMIAFRLASRGREKFANSRYLARAQERLGHHLSGRRGGGIVVLARFAPAGRSVVMLGAGAMHRQVREFLPWSALAGLLWAAYGVTLGYFGSRWLGAGWLATGVSVLALFVAGLGAAYLVRRPRPKPTTAD